MLATLNFKKNLATPLVMVALSTKPILSVSQFQGS